MTTKDDAGGPKDRDEWKVEKALKWAENGWCEFCDRETSGQILADAYRHERAARERAEHVAEAAMLHLEICKGPKENLAAFVRAWDEFRKAFDAIRAGKEGA